MDLAHIKLRRIFLVAILFVSPLVIVPLLVPKAAPTYPAGKITPIVFDESKYPPLRSVNESKFVAEIEEDYSQVLGEQAVQLPAQSEPQVSGKTGSYTIAILGDSMIDVMQFDLPQLEVALKKYYPQADFKLLNYGVGASDIEYGLERLTSGYSYLGREFPPLLSQNPDIIVVESFAYNHWENTQGYLDRQWLAIGGIVDTVKRQSGAKIVLAAIVAPDANTLGNGVLGLAPDQKWQKAAAIKAYLQNIVNFATSQGYPLADAYHASLDENGNGKPEYINAGDHLHPSGPGGELMAQKIAEAIWENELL